MRLFILVIFLIPTVARAQLILGKPFSDNMVLQRDAPLRFWGKANPEDVITITMNHQIKSIVALADSSWQIELKKLKANQIPQSVFIQCKKETIELHQVLIGDIWICIGQ